MPVLRRACAGVAAAATVAALLAGAGSELPARAAARAPAAGPARLASPGAPRGLTASQAMTRAKATGRSVVASELTTAESQTTANPGGTFTLSQSLLPVRAFLGGRWENLNATLQHAGKSIVPAVTSSPLTLSAGGTGPLAVLNAFGRTLSLYWPGTLPAPLTNGPTATYRDVLPGVNLAVTADALGDVSTTLVITTPAAAADPALRQIRLRAVTSPGLHLTTDAAGNLAVTAGGNAQPAFSATPPQMWDTPAPLAGLATTTNGAGVIVSARSGLPVASSATIPGAGATITPVPLTVSGSTMTLAPPAAALAVPAADFPLYIDPSFHDAVGGKAANWTQVDSGDSYDPGFATTTYWDEGSDLQVGFCNTSLDSTCNHLGVARSLFTLPIPNLGAQAVVVSSDVYVDDVVSYSCTAEPVQLWTTSAISSSTDWNTQNNSTFWKTDVESESYAHGYSGCAASVVGYDVTGVVKPEVVSGGSQTFGLRAGDESTMDDWKQFASGAANITISTQYYDPPNQPANPEANGGCGTSTSPNVIGNDPVTLTVTASDKDGDPGLATTFTVWNSSGQAELPAIPSANTAEDAPATATIPVAELAEWNASGGVYHWSAVTADENQTDGPVSATCYFDWDPAGPPMPLVSVPPTATAPGVAIGQPVTVTIMPPSGCGSAASPCPSSYTYQLGADAPQTVAVGATGSCTSVTCSVTVTVDQSGPITVSVTGYANGNPGPVNDTQVIIGTRPSPAYPDGYFTGGPYPSLLTIGSSPGYSLWLSPGTGNGTVGPAIDIGSQGTNQVPADATGDGPGDWAGADAVHGDFTGDGVEDVLAYYPTLSYENGTAIGTIIPGSGTASALNPAAGKAASLSLPLNDPNFSNTSDEPILLVGAGDASQKDTGLSDLIGILGDKQSGYELDLYTANGNSTSGGQPGSYQLYRSLSQGATPGPDGSPWNDFQLATAQPGSYPGSTTASPADVVLFALDNTNGQLWESRNPSCPADCAAGPLIGSPGAYAPPTSSTAGGTWTPVTGTLPSTLTSADINSLGQTELWSVSGTTITAYTVSCTSSACTASTEASPSTLTEPADDWPLTDGASPSCNSSAPNTALDTITGDEAAINGTVDWGCDSTFTTDLTFDGSSTDIVPPANTISAMSTTPTLSLWFKTTTAGGVLASVSSQPVSAGTTTSDYDPVMYIGSDGRLNAEWNNGTTMPIESASPVTDGLWHHAVLAATVSGGTTTQTLYLDGTVQGKATGNISFPWVANLTFGAGYLGGSWPDQVDTGKVPATVGYYAGELAAITLSAAEGSYAASMSGAPATFDQGTGDQNLFASYTNSTEYQDAWSSASGWSGFANRSGDIASNSSALYDPATGSLEVYAEASNGAVDEDSLGPSGAWSGWQNLGGVLTSAPAAVYSPLIGGVQVFGVGTTGSIYVDSWTSSGTWSGWSALAGTITFTGTPSVLYDPASGNIEVYARATNDTPYEDYTTASGGWSGWKDLGGALTSSPAAVYYPTTNSLQVFGTGTTGAGYVDSWTPGGGWTNWVSLGGTLTSSPAPVYNPITGSLQVFGVGTTNSMYEDTWTPAGGWTSWQDRAGTLSAAPVPTYDPASGNMEVYAINSTGTFVDSWNPADGWSGWVNIGPAFNHL